MAESHDDGFERLIQVSFVSEGLEALLKVWASHEHRKRLDLSMSGNHLSSSGSEATDRLLVKRNRGFDLIVEAWLGHGLYPYLLRQLVEIPSSGVISPVRPNGCELSRSADAGNSTSFYGQIAGRPQSD